MSEQALSRDPWRGQSRDEKNAERYRRRLVRQLERLGHTVTLKPLPEAS